MHNAASLDSYILINAESEDCGTIEPATCDCLFSRVGFTEQICDIGSFGKLTGQGMTLVGTDVVRILEERMPASLGGLPGDYQLVEHEGTAQTQLTLRVSPRAGVSYRLKGSGEWFPEGDSEIFMAAPLRRGCRMTRRE